MPPSLNICAYFSITEIIVMQHIANLLGGYITDWGGMSEK